MFSAKPRGPRILYVAASARELPEEVQEWLGQAEHRAASSPHIYDALALLAGGSRPTVMIVSLDAVDWSEMAFFDQAARISRETRIYVAARPHQIPKLDAACKRGAWPFDVEELADVLAAPTQWSRGAGVTDILAASIRPTTPPAAMDPVAPLLRPVPPEPTVYKEVELSEAEAEPADEPVSELSPPAPVRLASPAEPPTDSESLEPVKDTDDKPIPFPWTPSPNRPQRIPPRAQTGNGEPAAAPSGSIESTTHAVNPVPHQPVELTAEELSALMGRPITPEKNPREGRA